MRDKVADILAMGFLIVSYLLLGYAFKVPEAFLIAVVFLFMVTTLCLSLKDYFSRKAFYNDFLDKLEQLDQKYLITEMIQTPAFQEGIILCDSLYEIDKAMKERINNIEASASDFKDYIEMWIHEIKVPLSSLTLMNYNENPDSAKQTAQLQKMNYYLEQILFYARAGTPQKDYLLKLCSLETVINKVVLNHKDLLIGNRFGIIKENLAMDVITDSKWLEFMLAQVVGNSIKYVRDNSGFIKFSAQECQDKVVLIVEDRGIGISENDLGRVFDKTFTGENGRKVSSSTGMGLYICKKLCDKLGHRIWIESEINEYTKVYFEFGKDTYYRNLTKM